jgi:S1-C subfamily serine protease
LSDTEGVVIVSIRPGSVAARLGFQPGDVPLEIGGQTIESLTQLESALAKRQRLWVMSIRRGDKVLQLKVPG